VSVGKAKLQDFAELEFAENVREVHLRWREGPSEEEVLSSLKTWRHLRKWTYEKLQKRCFFRFWLLILSGALEMVNDDLMEIMQLLCSIFFSLIISIVQ
jgi:hypothetical protein